MFLYCIKSYHVDSMTSAILSLKGISKQQEQCLHKVLLRMQEDSVIVIYL